MSIDERPPSPAGQRGGLLGPARGFAGRVRRGLRPERAPTAPATVPRRGGARPVEVPAGHAVPARYSTRLPVALVLALDVSPAGVTPLVEEVARVQQMTMAFKPLFVVSTDEFRPFRRFGYAFEYVMPPQDWAAVGAPIGWDAFFARRLAALVTTYRPAHLVAVDGDCAEAPPKVLRALAGLQPGQASHG